MEKSAREIHEKYMHDMGNIIAIFSVLEQELTHFAAIYFCKDVNASFFLGEQAINKLSFSNKWNLFCEICKREKIAQERVDELKKHIDPVKELRNKVAHYQLENMFKEGTYEGLHLRKNAAFVQPTEIIELTPELMSKINSEQIHALAELTMIKSDVNQNIRDQQIK